MNQHDRLAEDFQTHRVALRKVAYRMLGSRSDADDAVQEAWLRLARTDADTVENLGGWLRTVVSRVCLDMLRSRQARAEELVGHVMPDENVEHGGGVSPEQEMVLADSVGRALLVVLDALPPAERVAFVLHDMFAVPFDEIAPIVDRSPGATKKLASRARMRVRGTPAVNGQELARHRQVVGAFLAAARAGDVQAVATVLAADVVRRADPVAVPAGRPSAVRGAQAVAEEIVVFGRNAAFAELALVNGDVGIVVAPSGRLRLVLTFSIDRDKIAGYELIADPARIRHLDIALLGCGMPTASDSAPSHDQKVDDRVQPDEESGT